jgi:hypothetical protein
VVDDLFKRREPQRQAAGIYFVTPSPASIAKIVEDWQVGTAAGHAVLDAEAFSSRETERRRPRVGGFGLPSTLHAFIAEPSHVRLGAHLLHVQGGAAAPGRAQELPRAAVTTQGTSRGVAILNTPAAPCFANPMASRRSSYLQPFMLCGCSLEMTCM